MTNNELAKIKGNVSQETLDYIVEYASHNRVENCVVGGPDTVVWFYDFEIFRKSIGYETSSYDDLYSHLRVYHKGKVYKTEFLWETQENGYRVHYPERHVAGISGIKIEGEQITVTTNTGLRKIFDICLDEFSRMFRRFEPDSISKTDYTAGGSIAASLIANKSLTPGQIVRVLQQALSLLQYQVGQSKGLAYGGIFALHYITNGAECLLDVVRRIYETMPDGTDKEEVRKIYLATSMHYTTRSGRNISAPVLS
ncbi:MAG: hypothetical protein WCT19_02950 [Candidatus Paceibacterota bacterium]